ncbi:MAG: NYN domain-containing protein [Alphaproteobacteria bacterium]|nr:NYN domain-containing protein [Alphaproteobacteria bacterium]MDE2110019.1 NYN domain-containing protein [Alphaproteobacteria bacterium]MDE2492951.1 NYN domain-containing protein [Alphaproteobacteria bacterium]
MPGKFAILVDGGFIKKKLKQRNHHFPTVAELTAEIERIRTHTSLAGLTLLRVYFYDAPPASGKLTNPISGAVVDLAMHPDHAKNLSLQQLVEMQPDLALREGETAIHGWALGDAAMKDIVKNGARTLVAKDLIPNIEQKGVDLRIGLDIARLSLCKLVDVIVVITGDSDMIPAFKFARREGVRVYLDYMGHSVKRDLKVHTDLIM